MASGGRLGDIIKMEEELIKKACSSAMNAHKSPEPYILDKIRGSSDYTFIFSFPGSWSVDDWFANNPVGQTEIKAELFGSLRSIGNDEIAMVNKAFLQRFKDKILGASDFQEKVEMAVQKRVKGRKQIVFTGHSVGGSIAILATLWFLEKYSKPEISPLCVTFGCPLTGNHIVSHALRRENWASCFKHFVMRYDIVPRILLAPVSSIEQKMLPILQFFGTKSKNLAHQPIGIIPEASDFYTTVMRNASALASHTACNLMGNTNLLLETVTSFIELSPYKPFGTYIFCTGNGKLVVLSNPDAVLQLLFYSSQLSSETEEAEIACRSLQQHFVYENELQESLQMQDVHDVDLKQLEMLPLSAVAGGNSATINSALNDLGLSTRARLCLRAAAELEKRKQANEASIAKKRGINDKAMKELENYRDKSALRKGCYDAFRLQEERQDFNANVNRMELAGVWDEIMGMLKRYELPDGFEVDEEWVKLGTRYRRLVEPLDIANYYRHSKNEEKTGPYMKGGRPKRYRYTQRWREHALKMATGASGESHFWAEVEELRIKTGSREGFEKEKDRVLKLEEDVLKWVTSDELGKDVFVEKSTLVKWWKTLPDEHKRESCLSGFMNG